MKVECQSTFITARTCDQVKVAVPLVLQLKRYAVTHDQNVITLIYEAHIPLKKTSCL